MKSKINKKLRSLLIKAHYLVKYLELSIKDAYKNSCLKLKNNGLYLKLKNKEEKSKLLYISLLLLTLGIIQSAYLSNWEWFSRSGSLLVSLGVYNIWLNHKGHIDSALKVMERKLEEKERANLALSEINKIRENSNKFYRNSEFFTIGLGTLIWGYGDLFNIIY